jgi:restriction endonuclease S subunit
MLSNAKSITSNTRWDSEYYQKEHINNTYLLKKHKTKKFGELCHFIKKGIFDLPPTNYIENGIPLIRTSEIKKPIIDFSTTVYISDYVNKENSKTILLPNDIVFTKIGAYIGDVALLPNTFSQYNFSQNVVGASIKDKNNSAFYLTFLLSSIGKNQILRSAMLSGQGKLELEDIRNYEIPIISSKLNNQINEIFEKYFYLHERAQVLYNQAKELLLETIGLKDFKASKENKVIKSFKESFLLTGRLDAEYYQPKYEEIENKIKMFPCELVENICSNINYGTVPTSLYTGNGEGIPYIKGMNLKNLRITEKIDRITNTDGLSEKFYTKIDDIIISQMGTVGDVGIVGEKEENYLFASFAIRIRIKDKKKFNPYYVGLYIQNIAKEWYLYRNIAQASVRQNTDLPTIKNMYIPIIDIKIQQQIAELIKESFKLRQESERLLNEAKEKVEKEIAHCSQP